MRIIRRLIFNTIQSTKIRNNLEVKVRADFTTTHNANAKNFFSCMQKFHQPGRTCSAGAKAGAVHRAIGKFEIP